MKTTIVPAQITSVEDRIAGNLSFKQLLLMVVPVFISAGLFVFLPPFASYKIYKLVIGVAIAIVCLFLALRLKERLIIDWIVILSRYNSRPRFYIYNKNSYVSRKIFTDKPTVLKPVPLATQEITQPQFIYNINDEVTLDNRLQNPAANLHFTLTKKGGLRVHIKEIE